MSSISNISNNNISDNSNILNCCDIYNNINISNNIDISNNNDISNNSDISNNVDKKLKLDYYVYLLVHNKHNRTYLGITNNLKRRIRQHNCEIKGGAKYTSRNLCNGKWSYYLLIPNLTKRQSLSYERIIKNKRRKGKGKTPLDRRIDIITKLQYNYILFNN